jgi:hypothetical protein
MAEDESYFRDGPTVTVAKATPIAEMCQRAGQPQRIASFLQSGSSLDDICAARPPVRRPIRRRSIRPRVGGCVGNEKRVAHLAGGYAEAGRHP